MEGKRVMKPKGGSSRKKTANTRGGSSSQPPTQQPYYIPQPPYFSPHNQHPSYYTPSFSPPNQQPYTQQPIEYSAEEQLAFDPFASRYQNRPFHPPHRQQEERPLPIFDENAYYDPIDERQQHDEEQDDEEQDHEEQDDEVEIQEEDEDLVELDPRTVNKGKFTKRAARQEWTPAQCQALCKAWLHISEDKKISTRQKKNDFYVRILEHFNKQLGGTTRTRHQMHSKWKELNTQLQRFNGCWIQRDRVRASGIKDLDVMEKAYRDYLKLYKKPFTQYECWKIVKDHDKWIRQPSMGEQAEKSDSADSNKRKSSDSVNYNNSPNDEPYTNWGPDLNVDNAPPPPPNRKAKKSAATSSSHISLADKLEEYASVRGKHMEQFMEAKRQHDEDVHKLLEEQRENIRSERLDRELKFFTEPHDHLSGQMLELVLTRKRQIASMNGWTCDF